MQTCTWAPTTFQGTQVVNPAPTPAGLPDNLLKKTTGLVQYYESLGVTHLLIPQRWWGTGKEIEGSSLDCLAMTALFAGVTERMQLITAIHPGFFQPSAIAKWGATLSQLSQGRWSINVTSGWHVQEFEMYGIDPLSHDQRYARAAEFINVLRGAWQDQPFSYQGQYYTTHELVLEPQPFGPLQVYQGGQSDAAIDMAAEHTDWMFLNGGSEERIQNIITKVRKACQATGRQVRFAMYAAPLCRNSDDEAWQEIDSRLARIDHNLVAKRKEALSGAQGMWSDDEDPLSHLDTNEGYAARFIGSPQAILERAQTYQSLGIDMLHLDLSDALFVEKVLPELAQL